ncbi:MAG: V-type ATP synthase subunit A [Acholeplasmataceae bacterium]|nr:V-type ATP synthase subunit A [Acholeplasmataceae bacterium]
MEHVIYSINGPVVTVKDVTDFQMLEMVYVGKQKLMGEVIAISQTKTTIQVYESTTGLAIGEPVHPTGEPISVLLGPGLMKNIFDGIERPLQMIATKSGMFIPTGSAVDPLDLEHVWDVSFEVKKGDHVKGGMIFGRIQETASIEHRLLIPVNVSGTVVSVKDNGPYKVKDTVLTIQDSEGHHHDLNLTQKWPIKTPRPVTKRLPMRVPLISGQRVIDTLFPIAKGGTAAVPGGFGTGKTMMQHQFAKWCDADLIVYVGCGERGNEMTQVLEEFGELIDPRTNKPLMERTILIANTSNMPVAAREASIYTGVTIAEYYRDMGYHVAVMADSTSRWAEALREISGRLEEMPAEEGFPAYLPSRISQFYERAGFMETKSKLQGSVTIIGAVSPQGADFSEPVTQNTKRFVRSFWALDKQLAYMRHYAAINWNLSYSEYVNDLSKWYDQNVDHRFLTNRQEIMRLLAEENKLLEIVKLIGSDVLPDDQKLIIEIGKVIRLGYLQQNAFHKDDTYVPLEKQLRMMDTILYLYQKAKLYIENGKSISLLLETGIFEYVIKMKYDVPNSDLDRFNEYQKKIDQTIKHIH